MSMYGTYSESLKARPIWTVLEPALTASGTKLQGIYIYMTSGLWLTTLSHQCSIGCEVQESCDFIFRSASSSQIYIKLLTPSSIEAPEKQETIACRQHFAALNKPASSRKAIAFLLSEAPFVTASGKYALDGLLGLQVMYPIPKYLIWTEANKHYCR